MRPTRVSSLLLAIIAVGTLLMVSGSAFATTETIMHSFRYTLRHGYYPTVPLTADANGNLYGTTDSGGDFSLGTVFMITRSTAGDWSQTVLYSFRGGSDGSYPNAAVIVDSAGNVYGTTDSGSNSNYGTVFKLTPNGNGVWTESVIYRFQGFNDGACSCSGLIFDSQGNLYGTTAGGGTGKYGTVYELSRGSGGRWTKTSLYSFPSNGSGGSSPAGPLVFDAGGNLYGTAATVVFKLTPSQGTWTESVLYNFAGGNDGASPSGPLVFDGAGNLYGTTSRGGGFYGGAGTVFELKPNGSGGWTESVLYSFGQTNAGGLYPLGGVLLDSAGNLYGTTETGGNTGCYDMTGCGMVFKLTPSSNSQWTESVLHTFTGGPDGGILYAGLISDASGNLYSTTQFGGAANLGAVFELSPNGSQWSDRTIYWFPGSDGTQLYSGLTADGLGNFYGTTSSGGVYDSGSVYKLSPNANGSWTENLIYSFKGAPDGAAPFGGLIIDKSGHLFGTTSGGGTGVCPVFSGCGTVFKLMPSADGNWTERVLYSFKGGSDGEVPYSGLVSDGHNLYGTTWTGGGNGTGCDYFGCGVIFELTPSSNGQWIENVIYAFTGGSDSGEPYYGPLAIDAKGNLYGTTSYTGCDGCYGYYDVVFELSPNGSGAWAFYVLYTFTDTSVPFGGVTLAGSGELYGTTTFTLYGNCNCGTVFQLTTAPLGNNWTRTTLYSFTGGTDGGEPVAAVTLDAAGNIYGTTSLGGDSNCSLGRGCGVVYELVPSGGQWNYSVLHTFSSTGDGAEPYGGVILDSAGNIYGTTLGGGATSSDDGTVFELKP